MPTRPIREGSESRMISLWIDEVLDDALLEYGQERGMKRSATIRAILRTHLAKPSPTGTVHPLSKGRKRSRHYAAARPTVIPDPVDAPTGFLHALRQPFVGRHAFVPGLTGLPVCNVCGATPQEDRPCQ
jgi:hypothetical protein